MEAEGAAELEPEPEYKQAQRGDENGRRMGQLREVGQRR